MIEKIEVKIYGDERMLANVETTQSICKSLEEAVKKVLPFGEVAFNLVIGKKAI